MSHLISVSLNEKKKKRKEKINQKEMSVWLGVGRGKPRAAGKAHAAPSGKCRVWKEGQTMHESTHKLHTPLGKKRRKAPSLNTKQLHINEPFLCGLSCLTERGGWEEVRGGEGGGRRVCTSV